MRVAAAGLLLTGCFYVDPIVAPPDLRLEKVSEEVHRGGPIMLRASFHNRSPEENQLGKYDWELVLCTDPAGALCDDTPFQSGEGAEFVETVPPLTLTPPRSLVQAVLVRLDARDSGGALATQRVPFQTLDAFPTLAVAASANTVSVGEPIDLFATYGDPDDDFEMLMRTPPQLDVTPPSPSARYQQDALSVPPRDPPDPEHATVGTRLIAGDPGAWKATFTVHDAMGLSTSASVDVMVIPDQPPCLRQWQPIVPPDGRTLPITAPTVFQVPLVEDDLDSYPPSSAGPPFDATKFSWSILPPGGSVRQILTGATGNRIDLDPGAYRPGDIVEVRVEIFDRVHTTLPCDDTAVDCSIGMSASCLQRQTWRVEVR